MPKKIISDMIVTKRSIRQIPVSLEKRQRQRATAGEYEQENKNFDSSESRRSPNWQRKPLNPKFALWLIAIICIFALFFGISIIFSSATVIVKPRTEKIIFNNETYSAGADSVTGSGLSFEVLKVQQVADETVEATEEREVAKKATGKIMIYNEYSASPQRLINNTRFESANGKIYRIGNSVVVPGLKKVAGKIVPGSVEAVVFADQPGEAFNLRVDELAGDFTIPGFKGDIRYKSFYARIKTDITGGLVGMQRLVSEETRFKIEEELKNKLREQLLREIYAILPENYIMFKNGYSFDFSILPDEPVNDSKVKISLEGNLNGIVFNNSKLSSYLAEKKIDGFDGLPIELIPSDGLDVSFGAEDNVNLWKNANIKITLNGNTTVKWLYDKTALKMDLIGKKESDLKNLSAKYDPYVSGINVLFRPVWTRYFPDNPNKIRIQEEALEKKQD